LPKLPKISKSFSKGRISYSKVRAMTRVATPKNEKFLLKIAHHGTAEQGALIAKALEGAMDELFEEQQNEPADVSADMLIRFASVSTTSCVSVAS
jgi:hypothetical protein